MKHKLKSAFISFEKWTYLCNSEANIIFKSFSCSKYQGNINKKSRESILSAAERRGTPVLLSASVSDNSGNSPQMAAPRRSCEIDQSTQRFHVDCDNRCLLGNEYGGLREFLGRNLMILILTNQAVFLTLSVVKILPLAQPSLF